MTSILICGAPSEFANSQVDAIGANTPIEDAIPCSLMKKEHPEFIGSRELAPSFTVSLVLVCMVLFWAILRFQPIGAQR